MGYRGSKSDLILKSVKEQRVDGSSWIQTIHVRCTLMGFERNYPLKILSKQLNIKQFSTLNTKAKLNPWFVTGLIDGEGTFSISIMKDKEYKLAWKVRSVFQIALHSRELSLLLELQAFFGGIGSISQSKSHNMVIYSVAGIKDLKTIIIPHFENYYLLTQKAADFILFTKIVELMSNNAHLTIEGLHKIINIKASMNWGISEMLKSEFKNITPVDRPIVITSTLSNPNWLAGFVSGEGCFDIDISKSKSTSIGHRVQLRFRIKQHERDIKLMELLIKYLGSGKIYKDPKLPKLELKIVKISNITKIIIPFFEINPLLGVKQLDYLDWCKVANLISEGSHLTNEGLEKIRIIKSGMNTGRKLTKF